MENGDPIAVVRSYFQIELVSSNDYACFLLNCIHGSTLMGYMQVTGSSVIHGSMQYHVEELNVNSFIQCILLLFQLYNVLICDLYN